MTHCLQLFTMEPFLYLDESMQHTIQDSRDGGVADIGYHGNSHQVAQSSTQQGDCVRRGQTSMQLTTGVKRR